MNSSAVPSAVVTLGRSCWDQRKVEASTGIITTVRDLQNQHLHPVATRKPFSCSSSRVRVISVLVHEANRVAHGKEHVREKDQTSSLRTVSFLILCNTSSSTDVSRITIHFMKNLRLLAAESLSPLAVGLFSFPRWHEERVHSTSSSSCDNK